MASLSKPENKPLWARDHSPIGLNYLFLNCKQTSHPGHYRSYKSFLPTFLHSLCSSPLSRETARQLKSLKYTKDDVCDINVKEGVFTVTGSHGSEHIVFFGISTCRDCHLALAVTGQPQWHIPGKH